VNQPFDLTGMLSSTETFMCKYSQLIIQAGSIAHRVRTELHEADKSLSSASEHSGLGPDVWTVMVIYVCKRNMSHPQGVSLLHISMQFMNR